MTNRFVGGISPVGTTHQDNAAENVAFSSSNRGGKAARRRRAPRHHATIGDVRLETRLVQTRTRSRNRSQYGRSPPTIPMSCSRIQSQLRDLIPVSTQQHPLLLCGSVDSRLLILHRMLLLPAEWRHKEKVLHILRERRLFVQIDVIAKSSLWGPQYSDEGGVQVENVIDVFGLHVMYHAKAAHLVDDQKIVMHRRHPCVTRSAPLCWELYGNLVVDQYVTSI